MLKHFNIRSCSNLAPNTFVCCTVLLWIACSPIISALASDNTIKKSAIDSPPNKNTAARSPTPTKTVNSNKAAIKNLELRDFLKKTINSASSFNDRFDAEVWLVDMSNRLQPFIKSPTERLELLRAVHREAKRAKLKPDLVLALIEVESHFDNYAVSHAGAQGLMQVMPFWKKEIGRPDDNLIDIDTNLRYGCRILQFYIQKEKGNWMKGLARYNGSYGKYWYPERVMNAWKRRWFTSDS